MQIDLNGFAKTVATFFGRRYLPAVLLGGIVDSQVFFSHKTTKTQSKTEIPKPLTGVTLPARWRPGKINRILFFVSHKDTNLPTGRQGHEAILNYQLAMYSDH
jgi:branched-subunit amino acid transport protein